MPSCDMCGKEAELVKAKIEGSELDVCRSCARFGTLLEAPRRRYNNQQNYRRHVKPKRQEVTLRILDDYAQKIRHAREKLGLTQEEFSKKLNEKCSILQKIETGQFKPNIKQARKLEKILRVKLVEQEAGAAQVPIETPKTNSQGFTMADFIKTKKKK